MCASIKENFNIISTQHPEEAPVFIWGEDSSHGEAVSSLFDEIKKITARDFSIVSFEVKDWNSCFSPWKAPAVFGKDDFAGEGIETLKFIENKIVKTVKEKFPQSKIYTAGYSLAGLFSLWSLYEADFFSGAVCCSSSLWFDGWENYASSNKLKAPAEIYMSLGNREEKSKNKILSLVGERTRQQIEFLKQDLNTEDFNFEWNEGGHFENPLGRLAKGIAWILNRRQ